MGNGALIATKTETIEAIRRAEGLRLGDAGAPPIRRADGWRLYVPLAAAPFGRGRPDADRADRGPTGWPR
jgi:hypothetical protein